MASCIRISTSIMQRETEEVDRKNVMVVRARARMIEFGYQLPRQGRLGSKWTSMKRRSSSLRDSRSKRNGKGGT